MRRVTDYIESSAGQDGWAVVDNLDRPFRCAWDSVQAARCAVAPIVDQLLT